jgi:NADP-dependent 3-hydroxy acid dehydrogenase YdfG
LLITGASSGIGAATVRMAVDRYRFVLAARRREPLDALATELGGDEAAIAVVCESPSGTRSRACARPRLDYPGDPPTYVGARRRAFRYHPARSPAEWALRDEDIAREVLHALTAPPGVEINEILIRPTAQCG